MDENELRDAMRATITQHSEPPPMESRTALVTARRAARRRNIMACAGTAVVVLGVTLAALPGQGNPGGGTGWAPAAAPSAPSAPVEPFPTVYPSGAVPSGEPFPTAFPSGQVPSGENTKPSWPAEASGDATADSGVHYQKGVALLEKLIEVAPAGYTVPTGNSPDDIPFRYHQAAIEGDHWSYLVSVPLVKDGGTGRIIVEVHEPNNDQPADPCELAQSFWGIGGSCEKRAVRPGEEAGIVAGPSTRDGVDQWVAFQHPDDTVVFVAQGLSTGGEGVRPLKSLPFTVDQLVEFAAGDGFK
ncbi:hypothetical protein GCM10010112_58280 [Actinoplanes lobatus]|uniref:Uncharacterized protein n=1 Tax=Actinoplanes lobatus TaxID=113568 RepID=A0A7W7HQF2_9ACTN|nr:hypothetical protein [Actinoplanes lobatus]MBB4754821.1 hypothetical protein [Actinoplanes lobatus]GGN81618.1 hypothetical protein GCM10010112_58280 [Actinoplanes lobatus]GIE43049.1 hypothetical protein Alo02nite_59470 [Actinoplanes lobatus]